MIYIFHKVERDIGWNSNWISPERFEEFIKDNKPFYSLDDYLKNGKKGNVITFDGVYQNVYKYAFPILKKYKIPFEMFVIWDYVEENNEFDTGEPFAMFCTFKELWEMNENGGGINSHSCGHHNLIELNDRELKSEISDFLNCKYFAYPKGKFDERVKRVVIEGGYKGAVGTSIGDDSQYELLRKNIC
jgi:peptidoglycan/xylan/chitin deacetylase (PgdA/CDA1 family)